MNLDKGVSTLFGSIIIIVAAIGIFGGVIAWQYFFTSIELDQNQTDERVPQVNQTESNNQVVGGGKSNSFVCDEGLSVCSGNITIDTCKGEVCPTTNSDYNHAVEITKVYQKDDINYVDVDFIRFVLVLGGVKKYYGSDSDEPGDCTPVTGGLCIVNNNRVTETYQVPANTEIINGFYPGNLVSYSRLGGWLVASPYFSVQTDGNIISRMKQFYIP